AEDQALYEHLARAQQNVAAQGPPPATAASPVQARAEQAAQLHFGQPLTDLSPERQAGLLDWAGRQEKPLPAEPPAAPGRTAAEMLQEEIAAKRAAETSPAPPVTATELTQDVTGRPPSKQSQTERAQAAATLAEAQPAAVAPAVSPIDKLTDFAKTE